MKMLGCGGFQHFTHAFAYSAHGSFGYKLLDDECALSVGFRGSLLP